MQMALAITPANYGTWDEFKAAFKQQFIPPASQMEAITKMYHTSIGVCDFATWFQELSTHARHTGVDETTKMWAFRQALLPSIQAKLLMLSPQPTTLDTLVEKAWEFDRNWQIFGGSAGALTQGCGSSQGNWCGGQNPCIQEIKEDTETEIATTQS